MPFVTDEDHAGGRPLQECLFRIPTVIGPVGGRKVFIVHANSVDGYVVAGAVFDREWYGSHSDRSPLIPTFPPVKQS
jgi:hypothetical protein